jgi:hypothetical protein
MHIGVVGFGHKIGNPSFAILAKWCQWVSLVQDIQQFN